MKILQAVAMEKCIGCQACALACARLVHQKLSWNHAGITIRTSGGLTTGFEATICLACKPAACAAACPTGACKERKEGGVLIITKKCISCGQCAKACPAKAIVFDKTTPFPVVCIHCGQCTAFCTHNCIELVEHTAFNTSETVMGEA